MSEPKFLTVEHLSTKDLQRIFSKISVDPISGCWLWNAGLNHNGYGKVHFQNRSEASHRLMYAWLVEPVPQGVGPDIKNLDHVVCDNRRCCNPAHIRLVLPAENTRRSSNPTSLNARKTHCPKGHEFIERTGGHGKHRVCQICHQERAIMRRRTPEGHSAFLAYHREYRDRPGVRERRRDAVRRYRERKRQQDQKD